MKRSTARCTVRVPARLRSIAVGTILLASCVTAPVGEPSVAPPTLQGEPGPANVGLRVVYDVTETTVSPQGSKTPGEKVTRGAFTARITANVLAVREGDVERVYDFANRREIVLDHAGKQASDRSLYAGAGFRDRELGNREAMARIMEAALGKAGDLMDAEMELGMRLDRPPKVRLKEQRRDDLRVFVLNDREVTSFLGADRSTPPSLSPMLTHLYLYAAHVHPLVRAELVKAARLPAKLEFRWRLFEVQTTSAWSLRELADESFDLAAEAATYPMKPLENEGVLDLAWRVRLGLAGAPPPSTVYVDRAKRLLDEGRGFEAFLALLEPLDPLSMEGGHVIHVLRANQRLRLQQGQEALQELGLALKANPFLVGPRVDVGLSCCFGYGTVLAWTCWDAARAVAPGSALLKQVNELEASLRKKHPEFF